jgi:hypothetical protein
MATLPISFVSRWRLDHPLVMAALLFGTGCTEPDATLYRLFNYERIETDPRSAPISAKLVDPIMILTIPAEIRAPSGISYQPDLAQFAVVTDDNELFLLDESFQNILFRTLIDFPAEVEGVVFLDDSRLALISEQGDLLFFDRSDQQWVLGQTRFRDWDKTSWSHVFGSAAYDTQARQLITGVKVGSNELYRLSLDGSLSETISPVPDSQLRVSAPSELDRYTIVGLVASGGALYLLSEQYSTVLRLQAGVITGAWGLQSVGELSGITIKDGFFYVLGDFEEDQPKPPIYVFSLEP